MAKSSPLRHTWILGQHAAYEINTIKESWNPDLGLTRSEWLNFIKRMSHLIEDQIINNREGFTLPLELGTLIVAGNKGKGVNKQYKGKKVRFRNNHSNEMTFKAFHLRKSSPKKFKFREYMDFRPSASFRKKMRDKIFSGEYDFYEFDKIKDIYKMDINPEITVYKAKYNGNKD